MSGDEATADAPAPKRRFFYYDYGDYKLQLSMREIRAYFKMRNVEVKKRMCLKCREDFLSEGPQNRMCCGCKR